MPDQRFFFRAGPVSLQDIADLCGVGLPERTDPARLFKDATSLDEATPDDVVFCEKTSLKQVLAETKAGLCLVSSALADYVPSDAVKLVVDRPALFYARLVRVFYPDQTEPDIHPTALIDPSAEIADGVVIGPYTIIGPGVKIGRQCRIGAHCTINYAIIGDETILHPGARIGQDGFGYIFDAATGRHEKIPQMGRVIIGNQVEIGANVTIDRGAMKDTVIGDFCIIDNLVQIGHNVRLGKGVILVAQSGIAGSSILEDYAIVAAQGGIADHVNIGKGAQIGAQAGVMRDIPAGTRVLGSPAVPVKQFMRQVATIERLIEKKE